MKKYKITTKQKAKSQSTNGKLDMKTLLKSDKAIKAIVFGGISLIVLYFLSATFAPDTTSHKTSPNTANESNQSTEERLEEKLHRALSALDGVGELTIVVTLEPTGEIRGAAVIAKGAENPVVRERVSEITSRLLAVGTNRISVSY